MNIIKSLRLDPYSSFISSRLGRKIAFNVGIPVPPQLRRAAPHQLEPNMLIAVGGSGCVAQTFPEIAGRNIIAGENAADLNAIIYDASHFTDVAEASGLYEFMHQHLGHLASHGKVIIIGKNPEAVVFSHDAIVQNGLWGFTKSLAKELRHGATAQLVYISPLVSHAEQLISTLEYLLSFKSAFVDGQVLYVDPAPLISPMATASPLAVVTGAARGIGAAIARVLSRDGARIVLVDMPSNQRLVQRLAKELSGYALPLDITDPDAGQKIGELVAPLGGVDILVHNAGVTRDRTLYNMTADEWNTVMSVNIHAPVDITDYLLAYDAINPGGRVLGISSIAGIAGNRGQTNYAFSKSAMIGFVKAYKPVLETKNITINAVAPGFIESEMTAKLPLRARTLGRLSSTLHQGGLPIDVAEAVAYFARPDSGGVSGNCLRVCGQNIMGA